MAWGAAIGAAGGGLSSLFGGLGANRAARKEAKRNRVFQKEMYQNRYQYQAADLEAAGLNRKLSLTGATSPPGVPSGSMAAQQNPAAHLGGAVAAAAGVGKQGAETGAAKGKGKQASAEARKLDELFDLQRLYMMSQANLNNAGGFKMMAEKDLTKAKEQGQLSTNKLIESEVPSAEAFQKMDKSDVGRWMRYFKRGMEAVEPAIRAFK